MKRQKSLSDLSTSERLESTFVLLAINSCRKWLLVPFLFFSIHTNAQNWGSLNQKSIESYTQGEYVEAIAYADQALEVAQRDHSETSQQFTTSLTNKAYAQKGLGNYLDAKKNFQLAAELTFELHRWPHYDQIDAVTEVAKIYIDLAIYDSAEQFINLGEFVFTSIPTKNKAHYDTALYPLTTSYLNLRAVSASMLQKKGQVAASIPILLDVMDIMEKSIPEYSTTAQYQTAINNLTTYYIELNDLPKAKYFALKYYQFTQLNKNKLDELYALQNLGSIFRYLESDSAEYYWNTALNVINASPYVNSKIHSIILNNIGEWRHYKEEYSAAIDALLTSLTIQKNKQAVNPEIYKTTLFNLAESYWFNADYALANEIYTTLIDDLLNDVAHNFTYLSDNEKMAFYNRQIDIINSYKSFALEVSNIIPLQGSDNPFIDPEVVGKLYNLQMNTKAIILNASIRRKQNILLSNDTTLINIYSLWEQRKNTYARALLEEDVDNARLEELAQKIEENEKWLTLYSRQFRSGFIVNKVDWRDIQKALKPDECAIEVIRFMDGLLYGALIITPETKDQPEMAIIMSTRSKHLEQQFYKQYRNAMDFQVVDTITYQTYWAPIKEKLLAISPTKKLPKRIYFSNEGVYNKINLNTLSDGAEYVIDQTEIISITNTKEILDKNPETSKSKKAILFGKPSFSTYEHEQTEFNDLPGSGKEVLAISEILTNSDWETELYTNVEASEDNMKAISTTSILHLATHGYFVSSDRSDVSLAQKMIYSGVVLAGANDPVKKQEDGLLTSFEILNLNLDSTELVVLSACETGLGETNEGEGVYGLQRALRVAGAKHMIMSLWKVDDNATQELMTAFYENWTSSMPINTAFRKAQLAIREKYNHPYYWGGFVLLGQ